MPFEQTFDPLPVVTQSPCVHLRSKSLYVSGHLDGEHPEEGDSRHYWCNQTQHVIGPDDAEVTRRVCIPGRGCYRQSY